MEWKKLRITGAPIFRKELNEAAFFIDGDAERNIYSLEAVRVEHYRDYGTEARVTPKGWYIVPLFSMEHIEQGENGVVQQGTASDILCTKIAALEKELESRVSPMFEITDKVEVVGVIAEEPYEVLSPQIEAFRAFVTIGIAVVARVR